MSSANDKKTLSKVDRDIDVGPNVINITVDINNIPESKRQRNSKEAFIGNIFTAFRNHQNPRRFHTPAKKFQSHVSLNKGKNYKVGHTLNNKYKSNERNNNQAPAAKEGVSKSWQRVGQNFWSKLERGTSGDGGEELIGAKLVAPVVLNLQQKPNKLVSFYHQTNFHLYQHTML